MSRSFQLVDVVGTAAFSGNPLAIIADATDLEGEEMQRITRWLNLSETTFLLPATNPRADYRVRIFSAWPMSSLSPGSRRSAVVTHGCRRVVTITSVSISASPARMRPVARPPSRSGTAV